MHITTQQIPPICMEAKEFSLFLQAGQEKNRGAYLRFTLVKGTCAVRNGDTDEDRVKVRTKTGSSQGQDRSGQGHRQGQDSNRNGEAVRRGVGGA